MTLDTEGSYGPDRIARTGYDAAGRVTKVETGVGVTGVAADEIVTTYTANGRVETLSDANGNRTTYEYDMFDRAAKTRMPSPGTTGASSTTDYEQLGYDAGSNVVSRRLRSGQTIAFSYDALGRLTQTDMPNNTTNIFEPDVAYSYDLLGRMLAATDSNTNHATFTYDALGRVTSEGNLHGTAAMQYDAAGRRTRLTYPGSGLYVDYVYNIAGEMTQIRENGATSGVGVLATYAYDDRGRRTSLIRGNGTVTTWAWDNVSRLTEIEHDPAGTTHDLTLGFVSNPAGQIVQNTRSNDLYAWTDHYAITRAYTTDGLNRYTAAGPATFTYDANGNLTGDGTRTYTYNAANQLYQGGATGAQLYYDPLGRLSNVIPSGWSSYRISLYDGDRVIAEDAGWGTVLRRYVFGPGIDEPLVWYEGSGTSDRHWLHADERGSIVAVSDDNGAVTQVNRYDEYGVPQGGALTGRFGYTGQQWIPELGMYYYRARIYSATLGRFMQTDPIGYGGGMNLYAYVLNDPVNATDPSGLLQWRIPTGSRIPSRQDTGICGSCSGFSFGGGGGGGGGGGSLDTYKITIVDNATKLPVGNSWIEVRGTGGLAGFFLTSAARGAGRCAQPIVCELWDDRNVQPMMIQAWAESNSKGPFNLKGERGFWISQFGSYFVPHEMIRGQNGSLFLDNVIGRRTSTATIFFHTHPFTAAEGGNMGFSLTDNRLINGSPWYSFVIFGYMSRDGTLGFDSIDRRGR